MSALHLITAALAAAFILGLLKAQWRSTAYTLTLVTLAFMAWLSADWLLAFTLDNAQPVDILTAGAEPPFAINLRMGLPEAVLCLVISLTGLLSALAMKDALYAHGHRAMAVLLIATMAFCGVVLTRDIFNLFVFFELMAISTAGLVLLSDDERALAAGFKYMVVSQIVSALLLIGIIFLYHTTGTLNLDAMANALPSALSGRQPAFLIAVFMVLMALIVELKPFPANGWALDIYESAHPAYSAVFSAAASAASLYAVDKFLVVAGPDWLPLASGIGIVTFVAANLLALAQTRDRRLLGYSSVAQIGLILTVLGQRDVLGSNVEFIALGLLVAHSIAKAGLFWLSGLIPTRELVAWAALRSHPIKIFALATFLCLLVGLPPFPGFYAKWELARLLAAADRLSLLGAILVGALLEATYLFRWFGYAIKRPVPSASLLPATGSLIAIAAAILLGWGSALLWGELAHELFVRTQLLLAIPVAFAVAFVLLEWLPAWLKNVLAIAGLAGFFALTWTEYDPLRLIFAAIFLVGGAVTLLASFQAHGRRIGFYPAAMLMYAGMAMLVRATDSFDFFAAWELLTVGSYFLILRGKDSESHALSYLVFSLGGAFLILMGFALAAGNAVPPRLTFDLTALAQIGGPLAPWIFLLLAIGFMTKAAAIGLHIWLPGAHAEAETDVSPMVSGILLKAGLYGLFVLLIGMGHQTLFGVDLTHAMLWIGALTALLGNLMAIFQEDAKRLLAYSSIGQMGYALFGLALMNHLGWLMALMFVINHYIYKSMLFLSVGGVAKRTGTRAMYQMGGLITLMPLSFIAVLIGIIAMSGVPPLSGFGGRWIFYNAILDSDQRLPMILIFFSGPIAFLYLFRLIHSIFLGQLKDEHRQVREAPFWIILPQMIYVALLIGFAIVPGLALRRVDQYMNQFFPEGGLNWSGQMVMSQYGYWNPVAIMIIVACIFVTLFAWLLFVNRKAQKVKQFNIVFAAERPYRPETTHFAWNFFAPYRKALGFLVQPLATRFWTAIADGLHGTADFARRFYTGNGQTYAIQMLAFLIIAYFLAEAR